ncbi:sensor histidine kinase [Larkinella rosea]|uniref:Histidine kinase n=1 Tax=Larkinella rosea TaxID=2025312 RepID=A0A3P1BJP4_9BACT|nr:histidine kinase [Larkinella rosea]RRB01146.1 histidine kinase [Larkinella rosea]
MPSRVYLHRVKALKQFWERSLTDLPYRVALHVGFWLVLFSVGMRENVVVRITWQQHYAVTLVGMGLALFLFYPLVYGIVPLLKTRNWLAALASLIAYYLLAVLWRTYHIQLILNWYNLKKAGVVGQDFWQMVIQNQFQPMVLVQTFFSSLTSLAQIILIPILLKFIRDAYRSQLQQAWLAQQNTELQLSTLKAQLNPHFFFNTLNNLQSFIIQNEKDRSVDLLTRLADFMRTSLYDCTREYISMQMELELLTNYVTIERVRFDEQAAISFQFRNADPDYPIPPHVFLPFIENTFKHGGSLPTARIHIAIELFNDPEKLVLTTQNTCRPDAGTPGGIGLPNVRKRLAHYFPGRYTLHIEQTGDMYRVELHIQKA